MSEIPEVNALAYGSVAELSNAIALRAVSVPCWVRVGRCRSKVTDENKRGVCAGLLMAAEMQAAINEAKSERQDYDH